MTEDMPIPIPPRPPAPPLPYPPPYNVYSVILQRLEAIQHQQERLEGKIEVLTAGVGNIASEASTIAQAVIQISDTDKTDFQNLQQSVDNIYALLTNPPRPGPVASFKLTITSQGESMALKAAAAHKMKVSMNPDGTATATISGVVDKFGNPTTFQTPPTYVCETTPGAGPDPGITLTPSADGLTCGIAANGALVTADTLTATGDGVSESYTPITVKAGPANSFVLSVS